MYKYCPACMSNNKSENQFSCTVSVVYLQRKIMHMYIRAEVIKWTASSNSI